VCGGIRGSLCTTGFMCVDSCPTTVVSLRVPSGGSDSEGACQRACGAQRRGAMF